MSDVVYILPVHNEERLLRANVERLASYLEHLPGSEIYLVENGSRDTSWNIAQEVEAATNKVPVRSFREENAGIGYAYHRGLSEAIARFGASASRWAVLTAADLPFGFSDIEAGRGPLAQSPSRMFIGSKAHPRSTANTGAKRRVMSAAYRFARRAAVGMRVRDSQGSVFIRLDLAAELLPRMETRGFFYSTELCYFAERSGERIEELPVVLEAEQRASTVRPLKDGLAMAWQLWELRQRGNGRERG